MPWLNIVNLILQALLLIAVVIYTRETIALRKTASAQLEASWTPVLSLVRGSEPFTDYRPVPSEIWMSGGPYVAIRNVGTGPALHVTYTVTLGAVTENKTIPAIPASGEHRLRMNSDAFDTEPWTLRADYESLSRTRYETIVSSTGDQSWERLS